MEMYKKGNPFDSRQEMASPDFEVFHSLSPSPQSIDFHSHTFYELLVLLGGSVSYFVEGKTYRLRPGDIVLISSREIHRPIVSPGPPYERYVLWLRPEFLRELSGADGGETDLSSCFDCSSKRRHHLLRPGSDLLLRVIQLLEGAMQQSERPGFGSPLLRRCYVQELLVYLGAAWMDMDALPGTDVEYDEKVSDVLFYINQNLGDELTLEALSKMFYVSKYHLTRQFKKYTGLSLYQYVIAKRLLWARHLLGQGRSATQVCLECGFGDYSHFSRSFKAAYGESPRTYTQNSRAPS